MGKTLDLPRRKRTLCTLGLFLFHEKGQITSKSLKGLEFHTSLFALKSNALKSLASRMEMYSTVYSIPPLSFLHKFKLTITGVSLASSGLTPESCLSWWYLVAESYGLFVYHVQNASGFLKNSKHTLQRPTTEREKIAKLSTHKSVRIW